MGQLSCPTICLNRCRIELQYQILAMPVQEDELQNVNKIQVSIDKKKEPYCPEQTHTAPTTRAYGPDREQSVGGSTGFSSSILKERKSVKGNVKCGRS